MNGTYTKAEREYVEWIKSLPCGVCTGSPPSDAHHIKQGLHFLCIPLCHEDCHQGSFNGIHGQARIWKVKKLDEMKVLNNTIKLYVEHMKQQGEGKKISRIFGAG